MNWIRLIIFAISSMVFSCYLLAVDIADKPLFLDGQSIPNIMFIIDDSGSMDWEILTVPHWQAQNYDQDLNRSWAKGGWIAWGVDPFTTTIVDQDDLGQTDAIYPLNVKVIDGSWISHHGYCFDRNADGLCHNQFDLNNNGRYSSHDRETIEEEENFQWFIRLYHIYHWNYTQGWCELEGGNTDANDYLPTTGSLFAYLTGSTSVQAHPLIGPQDKSLLYDQSHKDHPWSSSFIKTSPHYKDEYWLYFGHQNTYNYTNSDEEIEKELQCGKKGGTWHKGDEDTKQLIHTGDFPWDSTPSLADLEADIGLEASDSESYHYLNKNTGDYHSGGKFSTGHYGTSLLDINGDGDGEAPDFSELDVPLYWPSKYFYLNSRTDENKLLDNVYTNNNLDLVCLGRFENDPYTSADACPVANIAGGIENNISNNPRHSGRKSHIKILPEAIERFVRSSTWSDSSKGEYLIYPDWAKGTRHAMSLDDPWPLMVDWRVRSADFNVLYYTPARSYQPWADVNVGLPVDATVEQLATARQADFNAARSNPQYGQAGFTITTDLARPTDAGGEVGFVYEIWIDDAGSLPSVGQPGWKLGDSNCSSTSGFAITAEDVAASYKGEGIIDPANPDDPPMGEGEHICFSYINFNSDGSEGDKIVDLWDSHYRVEITSDDIAVYKVRRTPHLKGEALYTDSVYKHSSQGYWDIDDGRSAAEAAGVYQFTADQLANMKVALSDTKILAEYKNYDAIPSDICKKLLGENVEGNCRSLEEVQNNIANWYQYHRKRSFIAKQAIGSIISTKTDLHYGLMGTARAHIVDGIDATPTDLNTDISKLFHDIYDGKGSGNGNSNKVQHNLALQQALYNHQWRQSGTPLRQALQRAGEYFAGRGPNLTADGGFDHSASPVIDSCQKNFAIMLTDGYWSGEFVADKEGIDSNGKPITIVSADGNSYNDTLADVAKFYYETDLRPDLFNDVPTDNFNSNNQQHVITIGVGFGVTGRLTDDNNNGWPGNTAQGSALAEDSDDWGNPKSGNAEKIDDLWHAAYNSKGRYFSAANPEELTKTLEDAVKEASESGALSASAFAVSSFSLTANDFIYQATFDFGDWSGELTKNSINNANQLIQQATAQQQLDDLSYENRKIVTWDDETEQGVKFRWDGLTATQQEALKVEWASGDIKDEEFGEAQLDYIRGKKNDDNFSFRERKYILGDIVHSSPVYVGMPANVYPDNLEAKPYSEFVIENINRPEMVYVGANDGMLHGFAADNLVERFAYIPNAVIARLNSLTHKTTETQAFSHRYFVDETPVVSDAFFDDAWHTVLVGGLGAGGKSIYALDITQVTADESEENTKTRVLWEFTDSDLNYSFGQPTITKLANGKWGAIFGNGYAKTDEGEGNAALYIVDVADGSLIRKIIASDLAGEDNGLSSPTALDRDGDYIADNIYAGDLQGNVWRFDISSPNIDDWQVSFGGKPLFKATDSSSPVTPQPITTRITPAKHRYGLDAGVMLYFGTGQYLGLADIANKIDTTQTIYGIWDFYQGNDSASNANHRRQDLLQQEILSETFVNSVGNKISGELRFTSDKGITWLEEGVNVSDAGWRNSIVQMGWYMDLVNIENGNSNNQGERIISRVNKIKEALFFNTLIPNDSCAGGFSGWSMRVNAESGARLLTTSFDVNEDGLINHNDRVTFSYLDENGSYLTVEAPASGYETNANEAESTHVARGNGVEEIMSDVKGNTKINNDTLSDVNPDEDNVGISAKFGRRGSWIQLK